MSAIKKITAREILDSRGNPTIEVDFKWNCYGIPDIRRKLRVKSQLNRQTVRRMLANPEYLYHLSSRNFELLVKHLYEGLGYKGIVTKETRDGGVDIYLAKTIDGMPHTYVVQCKHTSSRTAKIGVSVLRDLLGVIIDKSVTAGIIITNAIFSKPAISFIKKHASRLFALGMNQLLGLMRSYLEATA